MSKRLAYIDHFRGLLMVHMALDHASMFFNARRFADEFAAKPPPLPHDMAQFLVRFSGVAVAPAFSFIAGFMVAITSDSRVRKGASPAEIRKRLVIRGLVLIAADTFIQGIPRAAAGFYSFSVLSCLGVSLIGVALLRTLSTRTLLVLALSTLAFHPVLGQAISHLPEPLPRFLYEPHREGWVRSLYPVFPWVSVMLLGLVIGRDTAQRDNPIPMWLLLAAVSLVLFFVVRLPAGYGNAYGHHGIDHIDFWIFSKYPPDLAWLTWSFFTIFLTLAVLRALSQEKPSGWLHPLVIYGRVAFFFYLTHFLVLAMLFGVIGQKFYLPGTLVMWLVVLVLMIPLCQWYERKKRERPNLITKYF